MAIKLHPSLYVHPGLWLKLDVIAPHGLTVTEVAANLGISRQNISQLLNGHASLTAPMVLRFEQAFGISADTLLRMQVAYDLAQMRLREGELGLERVKKVA